MEPLIEFEQVSKRFILHREKRNTIQEHVAGIFSPRTGGEEFWALRDVSFAVEPGQSLGLVGHNGAGKSTILKLMTRILEPTSGTVRTGGRIAALLELGSGFHPDLSGRDNVFLYGSLMGFSRRDMERRLEEIVDFADIGPFIDSEIKHYSSGMYTRLAFAVATAVDPDVLITDEVLAVGDEAFARKCMERIYNFRRQGKTIIFVSHALDVVRSLCDVGVWLDHGVARKVGAINEVIDGYLSDVNRREEARLRQEQERNAETQAKPDDDLAEEETSEPENPFRRGSRELEITQVELLGPGEREQPVFRTHEPLTIRLHYVAHQPIESPVFGIGLYHESGLWLTGPNTGFAEVRLPRVHGPGIIDYHIEDLPLLNGRYQLSVAVVDATQLHTFDLHDRLYRLVVHSDHVAERYGILAIGGQWQINEVKESA